MEDRRPIHYAGNTVALPRPKRRNLRRRRLKANAPVRFRHRNPDKSRKTCASLRCVWCGSPFRDYRLICRGCGSCQYCGLYHDSVPKRGECHFCSNVWEP